MFGIQASGGGTGEVGVNMEIGNEFHVGLMAKLLLNAHKRWRKFIIRHINTIHDDMNLIQFVIPGLTRNPGVFWIPAFAGMTRSFVIICAVKVA
jgi:hypothetical protein